MILIIMGINLKMNMSLWRIKWIKGLLISFLIRFLNFNLINKYVILIYIYKWLNFYV